MVMDEKANNVGPMVIDGHVVVKQKYDILQLVLITTLKNFSKNYYLDQIADQNISLSF